MEALLKVSFPHLPLFPGCPSGVLPLESSSRMRSSVTRNCRARCSAPIVSVTDGWNAIRMNDLQKGRTQLWTVPKILCTNLWERNPTGLCLSQSSTGKNSLPEALVLLVVVRDVLLIDLALKHKSSIISTNLTNYIIVFNPDLA